jgi:outer membrane protein OmpA-like peptidoglycan-associated protein
LKNLIALALMGALSLNIVGCASTEQESEEKYDNKQSNGALSGVLIGSFISTLTGGSGGIVFLSALAGGGIGNYIGKELDSPEIALKESFNSGDVVSVEKKIQITLPSDITFRTNSYKVDLDFYNILVSFSSDLNKYKNYDLTILGHTDDKGSSDYNLALSLKRAQAIKNILIKNGSISENISVEGKGEFNPLVSNDTDINRSKNRRVELILLIKNKIL